MTPDVILSVLVTMTCTGVLVAIVTWRAAYKRPRNNTITVDIAENTETLIDFLSTASLIVDDTNRVVRHSPGAVTLGVVQGNTVNLPRLEKLITRARLGEGHVIDEFAAPAQSGGETVWLEARAVALDAGLCLVLIEDRTEANRLDEMRRDFVANISHELKTPIGALTLLADAIDEAADDPATVRRFATNITRETRRLADLVRDIIQLSRVQSHEVVKTAKRVAVSAIVHDAVDANAVAADAAGIRIAVNCPDDLYVAGDPELLTIALKNLIENALRYSEKGAHVGVGVQVSGKSVDISVADTGMGIAPEDQVRIFERFYRVDESRSRDTGGTGLGLSIVKHIALAHHGEVRLFSKPGVGSTFTLALPSLNNKRSKGATE